MAYGGIAVSGGTTGHGTLIYTNLLYSPLLIDSYGVPETRPTVTLGGTSGATGYEAAFAADRDPRTLFKPAASDSDQILLFDLGAGNTKYVYGVVLIGHNLTEDNTSDATDSYALAKFEGGATSDCGDESQDLTINASLLTPAYHLLETPATYRYWRVRLNFNASTALEIGEAFLIGSAPLAFTVNFNKGYVEEREIGKVVNHGFSGIPRVYSRWERRRMDMTFTMIPEAQLLAMQVAARNGHVIFSPAGASGYAYFGVLELEAPKFRKIGYWDVTAHFTEAAQ
jgi:hypothetical protein